MNRTTLRTAKIMLTKITQDASEPTPNTMGNGPMKTAPPKLPEPPPERNAATTIMDTPTKTKIKPRTKNKKNRLDTPISSSAASCKFSSKLSVVATHLDSK